MTRNPSNQFVDLHTHSTASDGALTPTQLAHAVAAAGLVGFALTDHDTGNGLIEARQEAAKKGLRFVPGIEISAEYPLPGILHILGYFIDPESSALHEMSRILLDGRNARNPKIIKRLNELGCNITLEQVQQIARRGAPEGRSIVLGRPHIAQALVEAKCVATMKDAFDVYLGSTGSAFFDKERLTPGQALDCIHNAGGLAVLAHPVQLRASNPAELQTIVSKLVDIGLDGIEVWHSDHRPQDEELFSEFAKRYNLVCTGGSDFHGSRKPDVLLGLGRNNVRIPLRVLDELETAFKSRHKRGATPQKVAGDPVA
ncbi:MAG TPA: PHP domain-containing protein [Phycisphaerae bacterium]|nr:PHP domain-containing protein [Phycisphaerae bacterium]